MDKKRAIPEGYMTVGELAGKMGTTVRTLQYYDREGLLSPSSESEGGRRLYTYKDMIRLHQIQALKSLGFSLGDIKNRLISLDTPEEVAEDAYKNTELLLSQYTKVMFRIEKNLVDIDYEMYAEEGKHLKEMLYDLVDFDATAEKRRIQEKLLNNDMNLCLLEIMRDSLIALRDYPKNGQLYYRLLKYRYFEAGNTNEDVMLMLDDMPSTTYYRNRKKAIRLYATMLWAFTRPEKIQNKMEEINWKKSGSKVAVN